MEELDRNGSGTNAIITSDEQTSKMGRFGVVRFQYYTRFCENRKTVGNAGIIETVEKLT